MERGRAGDLIQVCRKTDVLISSLVVHSRVLLYFRDFGFLVFETSRFSGKQPFRRHLYMLILIRIRWNS